MMTTMTDRNGRDPWQDFAHSIEVVVAAELARGGAPRQAKPEGSDARWDDLAHTCDVMSASVVAKVDLGEESNAVCSRRRSFTQLLGLLASPRCVALACCLLLLIGYLAHGPGQKRHATVSPARLGVDAKTLKLVNASPSSSIVRVSMAAHEVGVTKVFDLAEPIPPASAQLFWHSLASETQVGRFCVVDFFASFANGTSADFPNLNLCRDNQLLAVENAVTAHNSLSLSHLRRSRPTANPSAAILFDGLALRADPAQSQVHLTKVSADGSRIATLADDSQVQIWEAVTGRLISSLPRSDLHALAFSPDGRELVTLASDDKAHVWDAQTGHELRVVDLKRPAVGKKLILNRDVELRAKIEPSVQPLLSDKLAEGAPIDVVHVQRPWALVKSERTLGFVPADAIVSAAAPPSMKGNLAPPKPSEAGASVMTSCKVQPNEPLGALEKRQQSLERELASMPPRPDVDSRSKTTAQPRRKLQEELLEVLFQISCLNSTLRTQRIQEAHLVASQDERATTPPTPTDMIEVTTYYATNRKSTSSREPSKIYGSEIGSALQYGRAVVRIPAPHTPDNLGSPTLWKLERNANPGKAPILEAVTPLSAATGRTELVKRLEGVDSRALLVFVHGFNTSFSEAALRTAQLVHDLKFPGMAFFYSWPSAGQIRSYWQDEEVARLSERVFEQLTEELSQLPVTDIYMVAHGMGNRIVGHALQARADMGKPTRKLRGLLLAAPDIDANVFRTTIAPKLAAMEGTHTTIYASSSDLALKASKMVHGFRRVGETIGGVNAYPGIETIDAGYAPPEVRAYGPAYLLDSPSMIKDIRSIIEKKGPAKQRGLSEAGASSDPYWRLQ
jgi:esterase/lipase superfamily enzyme